MRVISVNVGQPREVEWNGKTVRTAIWKEPVQGNVFAGHLNVIGDAQADLAAHGGEHRALMVYQLESYRYWSDYLRRSDFVHGQFGENLTVEGLADADVCIGDRFRIGTAVFEVTQPRVTCYRLGIRMNVPEMPALVVAHHRPGFYFRVIEEGHIAADDLIEKIADGPERMSVAAIDGLLYTGDHPLAALQKALRISALSNGWRNSFQALVESTKDEGRNGNAGLAATTPVYWEGFRKLIVRASRLESEDVRSFELATPDDSSLPDALPGQHIAVKLCPSPTAQPITRLYSLCGGPGAGTYRIGVKRESQGIASNYLHEHIAVGDALEVAAPRGTFTLQAGNTPAVLLSAGVGVTPLLAMLSSLAAATQQPSGEVWWIHSARNRAHHPFYDEIRNLVGRIKAMRSISIYSRPNSSDRLGVDYDISGHIDLKLMQKLGVPQDGDFYLCGPAGFLTEITASLHEWGVPASRVHAELFGSSAAPGGRAPHPPLNVSGEGPTVTFTRSGVGFKWSNSFGSLLEAAEACDVPVKWSCRSGVCHSCESGLISGKIRYSPQPLDSPATGSVLICCATPTTDVELDL